MHFRDVLAFDESPAAQRRLALFIVGAMLPSGVVFLLVVGRGRPSLAWAIPTALALIATAFIWSLARRDGKPSDWVFPVGIVTSLCCAIGYTAAGQNGVAFFGVLGVSAFVCAALFDWPAAIAASITTALACFAILAGPLGPGLALVNTVFYALVQGLLALMVYGKASGHRAARLRSLERNMNDIELVVLPDGTITDANDRAAQAYGYGREELLGKSVSLLRRTDAATTVPDQLAGVVERGSALFETEHRRKDGSSFPVEVSARTYSVHGKTYIHGLIRDRSAQRAAEEELRKARDAAEAGARAKSAFLANMSHEIRTPMNGVLGASELLLGGPLDPDQRQLAQIIHGSSKALLALLNEVLDFSKIEAGQLELESIPFEVEELVFGVVELFRASLVGGSVDLVARVSPALPQRLVGDPVRLRQVLANLVGNAVKFTSSGRVRVDVEPGTSGAGPTLRLRVTDTGIGISTEQMSRLFRLFGQADTSTMRRFGGTGLGLAISKAYVVAMGGTLSVESREGHGAVFTAEVPAPPGPELGLAALPHFAGRRAMIALAGSEARQVLREQLAHLGLAVVDAEEPSAPAAGALHVALLGPEAWDRPLGGVPRIALCPANARSGELFGGAPALTLPVRIRLLAQALEAAFFSAEGGGRPSALPVPEDGVRLQVRVLVAEDNPVNQVIARKLLERLGATVHVVANGREAVERATTEAFDIVFMDCQMPEMDGYDAARAIRAREQREGGHQPIVALTASALVTERALSIEAGMDDHLAKPVSAASLRAAIERWALTRGAIQSADEGLGMAER